MFGGRIYIDNGTDIEPGRFYRMLKESEEMPAASQPTPGDFIKTYSRLLNVSDRIISIHISGKLSGTINSAGLAAKNLAGEKIEVIDSAVVHMHCGFIALKAAEMSKNGSAFEEIIDGINRYREKIHSYFIPRSMENLIKGGRVSKIRGTMANLLEIKPILTLKNGEVSLYKNSRKWELAKKELLDIMEKNIKGKGKLTVSIGDVADKDEAGYLHEQIMQRFGPHNLIRTNIGIVVGSHLGIGGIGVTFFED